MEARDLFRQGCNILHLSIPEETIAALTVYLSELTKWNRKMNLVGKAPAKEIIEKHFLDSLLLLPLLESSNVFRLLDVGSGAGFPGLVLKAALPELELTLVEPRQKRVSFLRHIIRTLKFEKVHLLDSRLDGETALRGNTFPIITSRALASISDFLLLVDRCCTPGGLVVCMKGPRASEEISQWREQNPHSPFALRDSLQYRLPFSGGMRNLVLFEKIKTVQHKEIKQ